MRRENFFSKDDRFSFGHNKDSVFDAVNARRFAQTLERFFERLVAKPKGSVMHRHQRFCVELVERAHRLLGIHMNFARERRVVGTDWQERYLDVVAFADFLKALEVGSVAAMKNRSPIRSNDKAAKAAMCVGEKPRAPVMRRSERHAQ